MKDKVSKLDADIDDVYYLTVACENQLYGSLCVDVLSRVPVRTLSIIGEKGNIFWDFNQKNVKLYLAEKNEWTEYDEPSAMKEKGYTYEENVYIEEMKYFISLLNGETNATYDFKDDWNVLKLLYLAEKSSETNRILNANFNV